MVERPRILSIVSIRRISPAAESLSQPSLQAGSLSGRLTLLMDACNVHNELFGPLRHPSGSLPFVSLSRNVKNYQLTML